MRYKAKLVAQDFSQRHGIVMDAITFQFLWFLVSLAAFEELDMCFMDVVTTYLYGFIDIDI